MNIRSEIIDGKKRIIITRQASGISKIKEATEIVLRGTGYELSKEKEAI